MARPTLTTQLSALRADQAALGDTLRELVTCVEVLAVAIRNPGSVPEADLDENLSGLERLRSQLAALDAGASD